MITITGNILENRYTTAQWATITAILPDRVWGHEVDASGNPIGSKLGDGIHSWGDLPYWYAHGIAIPYIRKIAAGTPMPVNLTPTDIHGLNKYFQYKIDIPLNSTTNTPIGAPRIDAVFTDSTKVTLASINVYGNDDGGGNFKEDTTVTIY